MKKSRAYARRRKGIETHTKEYVRRYSGAGLFTGVVTVPVVVHIVLPSPLEQPTFITYEQIDAQIKSLSMDFRNLNSDRDSVPAAFKPLAADTRIQFELAKRKPGCLPTDGVSARKVGPEFDILGNAMKAPATGGVAPWASNKYLNVWIVKGKGNLSGRGTFPGEPTETDGVVIDYRCFGLELAADRHPFEGYDRGRTLTHEVGHWLNLLHIWGNDAGGCSTSDEVGDTPNQDTWNDGCPTFPHVSCNNGPNGDMFMNYMDTTHDKCRYMFTAGQAIRMAASLTVAERRAAIVASDGLIPPPPSDKPLPRDLWSANTLQDVGNEPDTTSVGEAPVMWASDDIWTRRQDDGLWNQEHQDPEYRGAPKNPTDPGYNPNYVYVRVRNRGCDMAGSGDVHLYWAKASTSLGWPRPWDGSDKRPNATNTGLISMGGLVDTLETKDIAARGYRILKFPWYPPNPADYAFLGADSPHFCLLSRITTADNPPYGMTYPEAEGDLYNNVRYNNNIVWKNVSVLGLGATPMLMPAPRPAISASEETSSATASAEVPLIETGVARVTIGGVEEQPHSVRLVFAGPKGTAKKSIFDVGTVKIDLGEELVSRRKPGRKIAGDRTSAGSGSVQALDDGLVRALKPGALVEGLGIEPKELHTISIRPEFFEEVSAGNDVFFLDVIQYASDGDKEKIIGGQRLVFKKAEGPKQREEGVTLSFDGATWVPRTLDRESPE